MTDAIDDDALVLFHYRDGLDAATIARIEAALAASPELARRYEALRATLVGVDDALVGAMPDAAFEDRLWQRLQARLPNPAPAPAWRERVVAWWRSSGVGIARPAFAFAVLCAVFGAGLWAGSGDRALPVSTVASHDPAATAVIDEDASQRVLAAYLAHHLENTERLFLVAQNDGEDATARAIAGELAQSNRVYALAAERAGRPQLARFLRDIEPVLLELATADAADASALQEEIRTRDLPFKARAAAQIVRRPAPLPGQTQS